MLAWRAVEHQMRVPAFSVVLLQTPCSEIWQAHS